MSASAPNPKAFPLADANLTNQVLSLSLFNWKHAHFLIPDSGFGTTGGTVQAVKERCK
jgi:hypothetical protein